MEEENILDQLAIKYGTDKSSLAHNYTEIYYKLFKDKRNSYDTILEQGIWTGASHQMWRDFFLSAKIFGFDNCDHIPWEQMAKVQDDRIKFFQGDQCDSHFLITTFGKMQFDMIIDDAGHSAWGTQVAFRYLFPLVKSGGYYIIEDLAETIQYREIEDMRSCTINFLESWKTGNFFSFYLSPVECFKYSQAIQNVTLYGELGVIQKK
jgi:hypothetical protein